MAQMISEIWEGLRDVGLPEVMLYLADNSASRCHWDETALIGETRVALLADQDRQIVRILPVEACVGIGIASPKGTDPSGYKSVIQKKLRQQFGGAPDVEEEEQEPEPAFENPQPAPASYGGPPPEVEPPPAEAKPDTLASRFGVAMRSSGGLRPATNGSFRPSR